MTDPKARPFEDLAAPQSRGEAADAPAPATAETDPAAAAAREAAEYREKLLRTLAEMENLRRRTEREVADARSYGIAAFARDVLTVADNMDRALQALDDELRSKAEGRVRALLDGVELTERELLKMLEKHGVRKFEPLGERFDPNVHQAMYEVTDSSMPSGQVVQVIQAGYMIGERMLRPALVAVSKNVSGAKAQERQANDQERQANDNAPSPNGPNDAA